MPVYFLTSNYLPKALVHGLVQTMTILVVNMPNLHSDQVVKALSQVNRYHTVKKDDK